MTENPMGKLISPPELTFIPKIITRFLGEMAGIGGESEKILNLEDLVIRLESEVMKIDAFKRELPLCMILMNDAIAVLKEELMVFKKPASEPVFEEFIPLKAPKKSCDEDRKVESDRDDKRDWLSSTQLWSTDENHVQKVGQEQPNGIVDDRFKEERLVSGLSLVTPGIKNPVRGNSFLKKFGGDDNMVAYSVPNVKPDVQIGTPRVQDQAQAPQLQTSRKQRRCWSTELHRRFVNALQQLGGSKAATPKQIRELMQVDGLTNDEVKSHLQKYRLHTKRFQSCNPPSNSSNVVMGGLWAQPRDHHVEKHIISQSGSPDGPLLNCHTGGTSTTGGDSMDDGEDEKSENNFWKNHPHTSGKDNV
ncbi:hypothetical protein L1987_26920 [Smallanthus sonchifolius]|uniref:Uncharacterized protein n=1 Tax=Smallanthus sonchifolius TaxID=185202 RepID=A0ACB9IC77_9ASTR|nr:hypothetical protein L1987_26920 [Smallanthus sonchifolius]